MCAYGMKSIANNTKSGKAKLFNTNLCHLNYISQTDEVKAKSEVSFSMKKRTESSIQLRLVNVAKTLCIVHRIKIYNNKKSK